MSRRNALAITLIAAVTGCFGNTETQGCSVLGDSNGLAGKGSFTYGCGSEADPFCDATETSRYTRPEGSLPIYVARGASFSFRYEGALAEPVGSGAVTGGGSRFVVRRAGPVGFIGGEEGGEVLDAQRLLALEPDGIALSATGGALTPRIGLRVGVPSRVHASARLGDQALPGALHVTFRVDDPSVAEVRTVDDGIAEIVGRAKGDTVLRATFDALAATIPVRVDDAFEEPDAGDAGDASDAGGDT